MSIRDLLLNVLIGIGVALFVAFVAVAESLPMWVLVIVAVVVWAMYIVIVIRDHQRDIKYPLVRLRPTPPTRRTPRAPQVTPYDQKEDNQE